MTVTALPDTVQLTAHQTAAVNAGLLWLATSIQPANAVLSHHGASSPPYQGLRFAVTRHDAGSVVVVDRADVHYDDRGNITNPLLPGEVLAVRAAINQWLAAYAPQHLIRNTWNGAGHHTGSFYISLPVSASLRDAFTRYANDCPTHHTVFCGPGRNAEGGHKPDSYRDCTWLRDGSAAVVYPSWPVLVGRQRRERPLRPAKARRDKGALDADDRAILAAVANGDTNVEIAAATHYCETTIRNRLTRLMTIYQARNRTHLAALYAVQQATTGEPA